MSLHTAAQATKNRFLVGLAKEEAHPFEKSERVVKKNILDGKFKRSNAESGQFAIFGTTSPFWKRKNTNETRTSFMKPVLPFREKKKHTNETTPASNPSRTRSHFGPWDLVGVVDVVVVVVKLQALEEFELEDAD